MPRRSRTRESVTAERGGSGEAHHAWVTIWKQWAVSELPESAPREVRVRLRAAVERALHPHHPADPEDEVRDVVLVIVEAVKETLAASRQRAEREARKREAIEAADRLMALAVLTRRGPALTAMLRRPGFSGVALTDRLKRRFAHELSGDEPLEQLVKIAQAVLDRALAKQPPVRRSHFPGVLVGTLAVASAAGKTLQENPELKRVTTEAIAKARGRASAWWTKLMARPPERPKP
jgi:hypothetical protein